MSGGEFDWGGRLRKGIGGAQRFPQNGWKPFEECKGRRELDCDTDGHSSMDPGNDECTESTDRYIWATFAFNESYFVNMIKRLAQSNQIGRASCRERV